MRGMLRVGTGIAGVRAHWLWLAASVVVCVVLCSGLEAATLDTNAAVRSAGRLGLPGVPGMGGMPPVPGMPAGTNAVERVPLRGERQRPVEIPDPWARARAWGIVGLVVAACGVGWWLWRRRPAPLEVSAPLPDPATVARARIEAARALIGDPRAYAGAVSDAVRQFLEGRFGLRAPEQTTEEFLAGLARTTVLEARHQEALGQFLEQCDLVKFAGWRPGSRELDELEAAAVWVIDETSPQGPWRRGPVQPPGVGAEAGTGGGDAI